MYKQRISEILKCSIEDARLVEGFMRLEYGTLDHLCPTTFKREAKIGLECVKADRNAAEELAKSYGL